MDPEKASKDAPSSPSRPTPDEDFSVFTLIEKKIIVIIVAFGAWFSTLSSFIYYPAIPSLAESLNVSVNKIDLTITTYLVVSSIAPAFVGDTADILGRRPVFIVVLCIYFVVNIAIALAKSYPALLALRAVQAGAISGTFSIAYGVIADVASPDDKGSYAAIVTFATTTAPSFGPILGGALTYAAGWPWIFWFLAIASGTCLVTMIFFLPETSREIVDDGSRVPPNYSKLPIPGIMNHWKDSGSQTTTPKLRMPNPLKSIFILFRKDNATVIPACGLLYVVYTCLSASLATLFVPIYNLNQWEAGLIYLPFGLGGVVSSFISGRMINWSWRTSRREQGLSEKKNHANDLDTFDLEKARLRIIWIPMGLTICLVIAFGWVLHYHKHIAIPLVLQFFSGLVMQLDFTIYNNLLVEKNHRAPAAAQASSNILRGAMTAIIVSFLQNIIDSIGIGWTFTLMGALCGVATCLFILDHFQGFKWRRESLLSEQKA